MRDGLLDVSSWWSDIVYRKLSAYFPAFKQHSSSINCLISKNEFTLSDSENEGELIPIARLHETLHALRLAEGKAPAAISVVLDKDRHVIRRLSALRLPASKQYAMAALDIAASTPFQLSDIHILPLNDDGPDTGSAYAIVRKNVLDPVLSELRQAGVMISELRLLDASGIGHAVSRSSVDLLLAQGHKGKKYLARMAGVAGMLLVATYAHAYVRNANAIADIESQNTILAQDAKAVRAVIDQRAARVSELNVLRNKIAKSTPVTVVWEELARALPDSAYLTDISLKDKTVSIAGYSAAASSLIGVLEGSPLFEKAEFSGAVVKVPGFDGDRFAINLQLGEK